MSGALERRMADLLRAGAGLAGAIVLAGAAWFLAAHGADAADYRTFHGRPTGLLPWPQSGDGRALMQIGIVILVATPIARVAFSVAAFARERNLAYVLITALVLVILMYSLVGGH
jgi:uncharacterized membrane protein